MVRTLEGSPMSGSGGGGRRAAGGSVLGLWRGETPCFVYSTKARDLDPETRLAFQFLFFILYRCCCYCECGMDADGARLLFKG